jgi:hypothetical protein
LYGTFKLIFQHCTNDLDSKQVKETRSYGLGWSQFNSNYSPPNGFESLYEAFRFKDGQSLDNSFSHDGKFNSYDGSGYVYEMRGKLSYIQGNLTLLKEMNWIDRQTRAIVIEFSAYNPNINLVMVSTILVEFLSSGSILTTYHFDPLNLFNDIGQSVLSAKMLSLIVFALIAVCYFVMELIKAYRMKLRVYMSDFWSYVEWAILVTAFSSLILFVRRLMSAQDVLEFFSKLSFLLVECKARYFSSNKSKGFKHSKKIMFIL